MSTSFAVTYDYRCPFARNAHEHVVTALEGGTDWQVDFVPFSLSQIHVEEGDTDVWDDPSKADELLALEASVIVAEHFPDRFLSVHLALFAARHDESRDLRKRDVVLEVLGRNGVDVDQVGKLLDEGGARQVVKSRHEWAARELSVFGVPTFMIGSDAAFVRIMTRPDGPTQSAIETVERVLSQISEHPEINEIKHTTVAK